MEDLEESITAALGKAPGPKRLSGELLQSLPAPLKLLLVCANRAILRGATPPKDWKNAIVFLLPKGEDEGYLDRYRPLALGQTNMKMLLRPILRCFMSIQSKYKVVSEAQHGSLHGVSVDAAIFMAQRTLASGGRNMWSRSMSPRPSIQRRTVP